MGGSDRKIAEKEAIVDCQCVTRYRRSSGMGIGLNLQGLMRFQLWFRFQLLGTKV